MKHNEFKAFFKKKLIEKLSGYEILSIDETLSNRVLYILDSNSLVCKFIITCWFGTNEFNIKVFDAKTNKNTKFNKYKDFILEASGNYRQTENIGHLINQIQQGLTIS